MTWLRKNPWFASLLLVCALLALAEIGLIVERWSASRSLAKKLVQRQHDLAAMRDVMPPPTRDVAKIIESDLSRAQEALQAMQAELKGRGPAAERLRTAKAPASRTESYFDLAQYVERMRAAARKNEVLIGADAARFGFAAHANQGPEHDELIEPVFRQRLIAQYLMEALLEARPKALLDVKREPPVTQKEREERAAALAAAAPAEGQPAEPQPEIEVTLPEGPDFFLIDQRASARVAGFVDTVPFRLVFTGQSAALRTFLNKLATFELPVLVREVQVDPASGDEAVPVSEEGTATTEQPTAETPAASVVLSTEPQPKEPPRKSAPRTVAMPIVAKTLSKFTVVVEYVALVPPVNPEEAAKPPTI